MAGPQLHTVVLGDEARGWADLGFTLTDHASGSVLRLGNTTILLTGSGGGFEGWSIDGIGGSVAGLTATDESAPGEGVASTHPNGICGIDHIVFHSGDLDAMVEALGEAGITASGGRSTDSYGSPMRQVFCWLGDVILELIGPGEDEPVTQGPPTFFGLALWSEDLDDTVARMGAFAGKPKDAVQEGRRIAGIRGAQLGVATPLAVMSPHV